VLINIVNSQKSQILSKHSILIVILKKSAIW